MREKRSLWLFCCLLVVVLAALLAPAEAGKGRCDYCKALIKYFVTNNDPDADRLPGTVTAKEALAQMRNIQDLLDGMAVGKPKCDSKAMGYHKEIFHIYLMGKSCLDKLGYLMEHNNMEKLAAILQNGMFYYNISDSSGRGCYYSAQPNWEWICGTMVEQYDSSRYFCRFDDFSNTNILPWFTTETVPKNYAVAHEQKSEFQKYWRRVDNPEECYQMRPLGNFGGKLAKAGVKKLADVGNGDDILDKPFKDYLEHKDISGVTSEELQVQLGYRGGVKAQTHL
eukprot:gnl/Hemi2/13496_TR4617_c0_g1_i1.p1 gnl/Hemi2/13496_TR4617_c0_g1~~gnl/Hemi2/13496_TR4617_c0_g1_i1.p1  ORF type:complete len:282 (-),score=98.21 gnl/Hemi2/13496_TR4617_c0_g1_i1:82-927(-)